MSSNEIQGKNFIFEEAYTEYVDEKIKVLTKKIAEVIGPLQEMPESL